MVVVAKVLVVVVVVVGRVGLVHRSKTMNRKGQPTQQRKSITKVGPIVTKDDFGRQVRPRRRPVDLYVEWPRVGVRDTLAEKEPRSADCTQRSRCSKTPPRDIDKGMTAGPRPWKCSAGEQSL